MIPRMLKPLSPWVVRRAPLPDWLAKSAPTPAFDPETGTVFVTLESASSLHEVESAPWHGLEAARTATREYLAAAGPLIGGFGGWLDRDEQEILAEALGPPPDPCRPLYIVAVRSGTAERIVYVGKTTSDGRFKNGHRVAVELHHPKYAHDAKIVYLCSIWLYIERHYVALEWLSPDELGVRVLDDVESQLIHELQPELNDRKRRNYSPVGQRTSTCRRA